MSLIILLLLLFSVTTPEKDNGVGGLKLGGYEKHQQRLRQERKEDYREYLAEVSINLSDRELLN